MGEGKGRGSTRFFRGKSTREFGGVWEVVGETQSLFGAIISRRRN